MVDPLVGVIILNYNGLRQKTLPECLASVFKTRYRNFEVILVDNASTDGSIKYVQRNYPTMKVIKNKTNLGFAEGNNLGIKSARGKYVVLLNFDTRVDPNWLDEAVKVLEKDRRIAIAQCMLRAYRDSRKIDGAGGFIDSYGNAMERGYGQKDVGQFHRICEIFYACGAAMIIRRNVFSEIGLLDPKFFMYYEETDLCWRAHLRGYKIVFIPKAIVYHRRGDEPRKLNFFIMWHCEKNQLMMLLKNYSFETLIKVLPRFFILKFLDILYEAFKRNIGACVIRLRAILWNLKNLRYIFMKRSIVQNIIRKVQDKEIMLLMHPHASQNLFCVPQDS